MTVTNAARKKIALAFRAKLGCATKAPWSTPTASPAITIANIRTMVARILSVFHNAFVAAS